MRIAATFPIILAATALALAAGGASAACLTKGAVATSGTESSAKWYAMETMVQAVDWALWPSYVATSKVEGYRVTGERFKCKTDGASVTCQGRASFCK